MEDAYLYLQNQDANRVTVISLDSAKVTVPTVTTWILLHMFAFLDQNTALYRLAQKQPIVSRAKQDTIWMGTLSAYHASKSIIIAQSTI